MAREEFTDQEEILICQTFTADWIHTFIKKPMLGGDLEGVQVAPPQSPSHLFWRSRISTHVQVTEVLVVVQSVAHHEAVGDFKSNIWGKEHGNTKFLVHRTSDKDSERWNEPFTPQKEEMEARFPTYSPWGFRSSWGPFSPTGCNT